MNVAKTNETCVGVCFLFIVALLSGSWSSAKQDNNVVVELMWDGQPIEAGATFRLGVKFTIPAHAHIYWRNPGDSGLATGIKWELPEGFSVGDLRWPNPKRFEIREIEDVSHGYDGEILLFADVTAPDNLSSQEDINFAVSPYWLVCLESGQCIPESQTVDLDVPLRKRGAASAFEFFEEYFRRVPVPLNESAPFVLERGPGAHLKLVARSPWRFLVDEKARPLEFFPNEDSAWELSRMKTEGHSEQIAFTPSKNRETFPGGVLTVPMLNRNTGKIQQFYYEVGE